MLMLALRRLRASNNVEEDIEEMRAEQRAQQSEAMISMTELICSPTLRSPLIISIVMQLSQQLSGINAVSTSTTVGRVTYGLYIHCSVKLTFFYYQLLKITKSWLFLYRKLWIIHKIRVAWNPRLTNFTNNPHNIYIYFFHVAGLLLPRACAENY